MASGSPLSVRDGGLKWWEVGSVVSFRSVSTFPYVRQLFMRRTERAVVGPVEMKRVYKTVED